MYAYFINSFHVVVSVINKSHSFTSFKLTVPDCRVGGALSCLPVFLIQSLCFDNEYVPGPGVLEGGSVNLFDLLASDPPPLIFCEDADGS